MKYVIVTVRLTAFAFISGVGFALGTYFRAWLEQPREDLENPAVAIVRDYPAQ